MIIYILNLIYDIYSLKKNSIPSENFCCVKQSFARTFRAVIITGRNLPFSILPFYCHPQIYTIFAFGPSVRPSFQKNKSRDVTENAINSGECYMSEYWRGMWYGIVGNGKINGKHFTYISVRTVETHPPPLLTLTSSHKQRKKSQTLRSSKAK